MAIFYKHNSMIGIDLESIGLTIQAKVKIDFRIYVGLNRNFRNLMEAVI